MKLSIVVSTQPAKFQAATFKGDLAANLHTVASLGYHGAELAVRDPNMVNLPSLVKLLTENNLQVPAIGTGQAWGEEGLSFTDPDESIREAAIRRIQAHIPLAAELGAVVIIGLLRGIVKPGVEMSQAWTWLVDTLQQCCNSARPLGVRLALEPINRYETSLVNHVAGGLALVEQVGAENFGLLLDTFHMNIEEPSIEESIRQCGSRIFHFHVADSNRWYPGAGHLDFKSILSALQKTGYAGFVSGEFLPLPSAEVGAKKNIDFLRSL